jgi:hypothetical protein
LTLSKLMTDPDYNQLFLKSGYRGEPDKE